VLIPVGYSVLVEQYHLPVLKQEVSSYLDSRIKGRQRQQMGGQWLELFALNYQPETNFIGQLQFALRYEGINLQVLASLFAANPGATECASELSQWLQRNPESRYARIGCFLYEWLTATFLPIDDPVTPRARYVTVVDDEQQFALHKGERVSRFRVINNLPGHRNFCPLVRKSDYLKSMVTKNLRTRTQQVLAAYDADLLRRAAAYLYMKETQSSFEVEREKPSPQRAQRFADLLRQADTRESLTENRLVELQNAVLDPRFHEYTWRSQQNWIGKDLGYRQQVDFVPARPQDLPSLMSGLLDTANALMGNIDPVVAATCLAFGFVYIHPFMDGNGRIHRYLIHDVLAKAEFTPRGMVLPVSAVILANLHQYIATLEHFSYSLNQRTDFDPLMPTVAATGNDALYYRYPDFTRQTEFLYQALECTVEKDLQQEIDYLLGFDQAYAALNHLLDWPPHTLELFIQLVHQNAGKLSANKRKSHFGWMQENEITHAEQLVQQAFSM